MSLSPRGLTQLGTGTGNYCLTPAAADALARSGIALRAVAPARLTSSDGRPCVAAPILGGSFSADFTAGDISFDGGFEFARDDGKQLVMAGLKGDVSAGRISGDVRGSGTGRADVLAFTIDPAKLQLSPAQLTAHITFTLAEDGAAAFQEVFGEVPVAAGEGIFDGHGVARLTVAGAGSALDGLL
ncbi:hypothetical protein [Streptomyces albireticuli]|uniref:hypothetical protein n=1 Tax=Streptomyces albireticuli TaxID=1940 RepID=UPI0036CFB675